MKIIKIMDKVEELLNRYPQTRDDDSKLLAAFYKEELISKGIPIANALHSMYHGQLSSPEGITRARRKLQEEKPQLRGKRYVDRITTQEQETRNEMRN